MSMSEMSMMDSLHDNTEVWDNEQIIKSAIVKQYDKIDITSMKYVGGLDISFYKNSNIAVAFLSIYDLSTKTIVYEEWKRTTLTVPYVSGYLGFREVPVYIELLQQLVKNKPSGPYPDVLMIDGFGILHPRKFGSASQIGVELDIPTIGIGKTMLNIDGLDEGIINSQFKVCKKGEYIELIGTTGTKYGVAYKSSNNCLNPIYISVGHNISLTTAIKVVNMCTTYRVPEPIRNSDIKSNALVKSSQLIY